MFRVVRPNMSKYKTVETKHVKKPTFHLDMFHHFPSFWVLRKAIDAIQKAPNTTSSVAGGSLSGAASRRRTLARLEEVGTSAGSGPRDGRMGKLIPWREQWLKVETMVEDWRRTWLQHLQNMLECWKTMAKNWIKHMVNDNGGNIWKHVFLKQKIIRRSYMNHGCEGIGGHPSMNQNRVLRTEATNWFRVLCTWK